MKDQTPLYISIILLIYNKLFTIFDMYNDIFLENITLKENQRGILTPI
jgi:hypothetical protein